MNKIRVTKKEIKENCFKNELVAIGYCEAQYLLFYKAPFAYSGSIYGWACDYYRITDKNDNDLIISTGYAPIGQALTYDLVKKYDLKAEKIILNNKIENKKEKVQKLLLDFMKDAKSELEQEAQK